ncbi:MAG: type II secretion system protein GspG [Lentisphaeria bacterium]|nr:type II secretion system protein GspG [Lentisphaeria bacterium]
MKRFKHPFTLVELLCVIIVIALLAAISIKVTQIAYRRADETKTKSVMEIIRVANEQYKAKNGYYFPNGGSTYSEGGAEFHSIDLNADFLGDAYETCRSIAEESGNADKIRDAWGNAIRYRNPGIYNTGTYDLYSIGRDKGVGDAEDTTKKKPGFGDDIANFKYPDLK